MLKLNFWWACHKFWLIMRIRLCRALSQGAVAALPRLVLPGCLLALPCILWHPCRDNWRNSAVAKRSTLNTAVFRQPQNIYPNSRAPLSTPPGCPHWLPLSPKCPTQFIIQLNWPQSRISKFREFPQSSQFTVRRHLWAPLCFEWSFKVAHANPLMSFCRCHRLSFQ